jgi:hypothetical protein
MNKGQENKVSMYRTVQGVVEDNITIVDSNAALKKVVADFIASLGPIEESDKAFQTAAAGTTAEKKKATEVLIKFCIKVTSCLHSWAAATGNSEVLAVVDVSPSDLKRLRDTALQTKAIVFKEYAETNADALTAYSLTPVMLAGFRNAIALYEQKLKAKAAGFKKKTTSNKALPGLFKNTDAILNDQVDEQMNIIQDEHPEFYAAYRAARRIGPSGTRHNPPPGSGGSTGASG